MSAGNSAVANRATAMTAALWLAAAAVLLMSLLASFRRGFADDLATAWLVNGPRVLFAAAVGAALSLSGGLRLAAGREPALRELEILAASAGAASSGWFLARHASGVAALTMFSVGAIAAGVILVAFVRWLDRPRRWTNLIVAALLAALATGAAFAGTYVRERNDWLVPIVTWLLGDLGGTTLMSGAALLVLTAVLGASALSGTTTRRSAVSLAAFGIAVGAAGPLAFVGTLAPRTVRWLAAGASETTLLLSGMIAGAATVAAVDAVPRLLLGGYDFPWNLPATMLAIPIFLGWNRARLRREAGPAHFAFEMFEIAVIVGLTLGALALALVLTRVIHAAT